MKTISLSELRTKLLAYNHAQPLSFTARTVPDYYKTGCPHPEIYKVSKVWPMVGTSYGSAVNNQLTREGQEATFEPLPARYERIGGILVRYVGTGNECIACQFRTVSAPTDPKQYGKPTYLVRDTTAKYLRIVSKDTLAKWLKVKAEGTRQGTERPVIWRTYGLANIVSIKLNGEHYRVRN